MNNDEFEEAVTRLGLRVADVDRFAQGNSLSRASALVVISAAQQLYESLSGALRPPPPEGHIAATFIGCLLLCVDDPNFANLLTDIKNHPILSPGCESSRGPNCNKRL